MVHSQISKQVFKCSSHSDWSEQLDLCHSADLLTGVWPIGCEQLTQGCVKVTKNLHPIYARQKLQSTQLNSFDPRPKPKQGGNWILTPLSALPFVVKLFLLSTAGQADWARGAYIVLKVSLLLLVSFAQTYYSTRTFNPDIQLLTCYGLGLG